MTRLAIALPLVCALAALVLWAVKRGRLRLPALALTARMPAGAQLLDVLEVRALSPVARLAVIRFDGRTHLLGVTGHAICLLAPAPDAAAPRAEDPQ